MKTLNLTLLFVSVLSLGAINTAVAETSSLDSIISAIDGEYNYGQEDTVFKSSSMQHTPTPRVNFEMSEPEAGVLDFEDFWDVEMGELLGDITY